MVKVNDGCPTTRESGKEGEYRSLAGILVREVVDGRFKMP